MAQMSIKKQKQAIAYFKKFHNEPIAMSNVKSHTLIITNLSCLLMSELEELKEKGFNAAIFEAAEWDGFHGLETYINERYI